MGAIARTAGLRLVITEWMYVSWGGIGRAVALRAAFQVALQRNSALVYLAILDQEAFGDLDDTYLKLVIDELQWLLDAQLRLVASQLGAEGHQARILVRVGDVFEELAEVVKAAEVSLILLPEEVAETVPEIQSRTGAVVETV